MIGELSKAYKERLVWCVSMMDHVSDGAPDNITGSIHQLKRKLNCRVSIFYSWQKIFSSCQWILQWV